MQCLFYVHKACYNYRWKFSLHQKSHRPECYCLSRHVLAVLSFPMRGIILHRFRVRSFGRIRIRISDLWRSFGANPFSDQWSIKSTLDKDSSDHWSERSANGSSDQWSGAFLWVKDPKLITVRSGFGLELDMYFIYEIYFRVRSTAFVLWWVAFWN